MHVRPASCLTHRTSMHQLVLDEHSTRPGCTDACTPGTTCSHGAHRCWRVRPWIVAATAPQLAACGSQVCTMSAPSLNPFRTCAPGAQLFFVRSLVASSCGTHQSRHAHSKLWRLLHLAKVELSITLRKRWSQKAFDTHHARSAHTPHCSACRVALTREVRERARLDGERAGQHAGHAAHDLLHARGLGQERRARAPAPRRPASPLLQQMSARHARGSARAPQSLASPL